MVLAKYKGALPAGWGSEEFFESHWLEIQEHALINKLGEEYASNRWCHWADRFHYHKDGFDILLMVLLYIAIARGVITSLADIPHLAGCIGPRALQALSSPTDTVDANLKSLKD